ncbi:uncharacterized protein [Drosophila virilis]|uniref:Uncharacterized protein n=1 Tax=Drosophila virilis TaxID=7244 RepID=B4LE99_DROVI|nr:uncharacterized protein LOC6623106 [Drosophila virilis]EDW69055.1 uncharacterized protein Dvir_GJ12332 [Drosophila virilis]
MYTGLLLSLSVAWILLPLLVDGYDERYDRIYEPLSVKFRTSDPSKLEANATVGHMGRKGRAFMGKMLVKVDMDDTLMVEATSYRSNDGHDYTILPYHIPKQGYKSFAESFYKDIIYKELKQCSNIPEPKKAYPWPKGTYIFDNCVPTGDGWPKPLSPGYYKINFNISGQVEADLSVIVVLRNMNGGLF